MHSSRIEASCGRFPWSSSQLFWSLKWFRLENTKRRGSSSRNRTWVTQLMENVKGLEPSPSWWWVRCSSDWATHLWACYHCTNEEVIVYVQSHYKSLIKRVKKRKIVAIKIKGLLILSKIKRNASSEDRTHAGFPNRPSTYRLYHSAIRANREYQCEVLLDNLQH